MPEFGPRQPMDEEKNKKEGDEISRRDFLKKTGLALGALIGGASALEMAGCSREDKRAREEEERMRKSGENIEDMLNKDKAEEAIKNDPLSGYDGFKHFRDLNKDVQEGSEEYKAAEDYFKNREKK
ncbi:twin-arginine translocation signal domain-containing protein [Patescibacteria group bacterium]|nr:MAG: twin-arginine translocation signal domain-containing protein [Patescibacteria group bacterium]